MQVLGNNGATLWRLCAKANAVAISQVVQPKLSVHKQESWGMLCIDEIKTERGSAALTMKLFLS